MSPAGRSPPWSVGLPDPHPYALGHSFATAMLALEVDSHVVSDMLGRTTIRMTEHDEPIMSGMRRDAANAFGTTLCDVVAPDNNEGDS